ncbi:MAG: class I SAM-dependent methyltransferase [Alphaproteobacteria bacterium]
MAAGDVLGAHRAAWMEKPVLREIYQDLYRRMADSLVPGATLEVGGGTGNFKDYRPGAVSTDIQFAPWLDAVCDAHALPFADSTFANVVLFDVLHHLARPRLFLGELVRVLRPGGRGVLVEPAITPVSWLAYALLHDEPVRMGEDPLIEGPLPARRDPYAANQGVPTLLFGPVLGRRREAFRRAFPALSVRSVRMLSLFAYPLSGGFRRWSLVPAGAVRALLRIEDRLLPVLGPLLAFRMLVVLERR